jgi:hypothetical protein
LPAALLLTSATSLPAQESSMPLPVGTRPPDAAANAAIESMHIPTTPGEIRKGSTVRFGFVSLVARDSSGRMYFESRRTLAPSGELLPRAYFIVIDPGEHTRTMCYVATKTCRVDAFRHVSYDEQGDGDEAPPASATESVNLGTHVIESLTVLGTRETRVIAAGAYGNSQPMITTKEVWHSPELDLDISIVRTDPRWGTESRKMTEISRSEPDGGYFAIPADYQLLDNRPNAKK